MRAVYGSALALSLAVVAGASRADDQTEAKAVIDKALKAMGGAEKVAKFAAGTFKGTIAHDRDGRSQTITATGAWQGLDKFRLEGELAGGGEAKKVLLVINGDSGWAKKGDQGRATPEELVPALKRAFYALRMPHLLPRLKGPEFALTPQGTQQVDGKEAVALTVGHKDHPDVVVCFDKETGLPAKSQVRITGPDGREIAVEFFYADFQDANGVKHPMKIVLKADGNEFVIELSAIQPKERVDDSAFAIP